MELRVAYVLIVALVVIIIILALFRGCGTSAVGEVGGEKFKNQIGNQHLGEIVLYYSTSCGYCTMFMPTWDKFEQYAAANLHGLIVRKMKCDGDQGQVCFDKYNVQGFPTVMLYTKNGNKIMFDKNRTVDDLVNFVNENKEK